MLPVRLSAGCANAGSLAEAAGLDRVTQKLLNPVHPSPGTKTTEARDIRSLRVALSLRATSCNAENTATGLKSHLLDKTLGGHLAACHHPMRAVRAGGCLVLLFSICPEKEEKKDRDQRQFYRD